MITEKTVYVTDDGKKFSTRKAAEKHEEEFPKIMELKEALQTIYNFCKWFRKERTDATDECITYNTKCPLYDRCKNTILLAEIILSSGMKLIISDALCRIPL